MASSSPSLKFRRAQHQSRDHAQIHLLARIIELGLQDLRIIELFLERLNRGRPRLSAEKDLHRAVERGFRIDRKSTRLNSSHLVISYAVFCLKKKKKSKIIS